VSLRGRPRNLEREATVSLVVVEHVDGKTSRFREDEVLPACFLHAMERGARHFAREHPAGEAHSFVVALRSATNLDALMRDQGTMVGHFLGEDEIIRRVCARGPGPR